MEIGYYFKLSQCWNKNKSEERSFYKSGNMILMWFSERLFHNFSVVCAVLHLMVTKILLMRSKKALRSKWAKKKGDIIKATVDIDTWIPPESSLSVLLNKVRFTTDYIPLMDLPLVIRRGSKAPLGQSQLLSQFLQSVNFGSYLKPLR